VQSDTLRPDTDRLWEGSVKVRHLVGMFAIVGAIGLGTAVPTSAESTNLVTNGDFETPIAPPPPASPANIISVSGSQLDGWTIEGSGVMDVTNKNFSDNGSTVFPVFSGNQSLDLNSLDPATMTQDLTTVAGSTYHVFFALTGLPPVPAHVLLHGGSSRRRDEHLGVVATEQLEGDGLVGDVDVTAAKRVAVAEGLGVLVDPHVQILSQKRDALLRSSASLTRAAIRTM